MDDDQTTELPRRRRRQRPERLEIPFRVADSTTDLPHRRRRQRPERAWESPFSVTSCNPLDSPLVRSASGPPVIAHPAQKSHTHAHAELSPQDGGARTHPIDQGIGGKRIYKKGSPKISRGGSPHTPSASTGPNPTTSPNHDSLRSPFARKFLWTHKSRPDSLLARAPRRHRHVCAECASRAHSDGKAHEAAADTGEHVIPRTESEPLLEPAKPLLHWARRPVAGVELQRANSLQEVQVGLAGAPPLRNNRPSAQRHLKAVSHALIASSSMSAPRDFPRGVSNDEVNMLAWEHIERLKLGRRRSGEAEALEESERSEAPPLQPRAGRKLLRAASSDALLKRSTSRALSLLRETGYDDMNRAEV